MELMYTGELAALATAVSWSFSGVFFETATKRAGALTVNFVKLIFGFVFISIFALIFRGKIFPYDASTFNWLMLGLSAFVSIIIGDMLVFKAYAMITARITLLLLSLSPIVSSIISYFILNEKLSLFSITGIFLTIAGVALVVLQRNKEHGKIGFSKPIKGIIIGLIGTLCNSFGFVISKIGMKGYDPAGSSQIRVITALSGYFIMILIMRHFGKVKTSIKDKTSLKFIFFGSVFGPFLAILLSLIALQNTQVGIASSIMSTGPVLIIIPAVIFLKEKVNLKEVAGALVTVCGIIVFFVSGNSFK